MSVGTKDFPWFPQRVSPFRYRFCDNFEVLIEKEGNEIDSPSPRMRRCWDVHLTYRSHSVILKVFEEITSLETPSCEQCRCNGWNHHPVSTKTIHFIVPSSKFDLSDDRTFESKAHVLHGVVHYNGFGHLLRINGVEGGSGNLRGAQVMMLWDSLCRILRVRDITVEDVSNKKGMLLRVLLPISSQSTFYMKHGYRFGRGQFNVGQSNWAEAMRSLHHASLNDLITDFDGVDEIIKLIVARYRGMGQEEPATVGALLSKMLYLTENESAAADFAARHLISAKTETEEESDRVLSEGPKANGMFGAAQDGEGTQVVSEHQSTGQPSAPTLSASAGDSDCLSSEGTRTDCSTRAAGDPGDLIRPHLAAFDAASLFEGTRKYSATKMVEIIRITLGVLQSYENRWVRLQDLRDVLYDTAHDRVLADFILGKMANTVVNGFSIIKQRSKKARCHYYLFEKRRAPGGATKEAFLSEVSEPALPAPGPEVVNGQSLERFEEYLALLFKWMCHQPHISIGRGPNKSRHRAKRKEPEPDSQSSPLRQAGSGQPSAVKIKIAPPTVVRAPWLEVYPSEVEPHLAVLKASGPHPGSVIPFRKYILADLLYFYQSVLETYKPVTEANKTSILLRDFPRQVHILKDTKFFVKRFQPDPIPSIVHSNGTSGLMSLVCQVILDPTVPPTLERSRLKTQQPDFFRMPPPKEEIFMPIGSSVVDVKHAVEEAFRKIYTMFECWRVGTMSNLKLPVSPSDSITDKTVDVRGHMITPDLELRHSGGIEDWEVLCSCGTRDDDGARMLCCDQCSVWMHTRCAGYRDDAGVPGYFLCPYCLKEFD